MSVHNLAPVVWMFTGLESGQSGFSRIITSPSENQRNFHIIFHTLVHRKMASLGHDFEI